MLNWQRCRYACQLLLFCWHPAVLAAAVKKHLLFLLVIPCSLGVEPIDKHLAVMAAVVVHVSINGLPVAASHLAPADAGERPVLHVIRLLLHVIRLLLHVTVHAGCVRPSSLQLIRPAAATTAAAVVQAQTGTGGPAPST